MSTSDKTALRAFQKQQQELRMREINPEKVEEVLKIKNAYSDRVREEFQDKFDSITQKLESLDTGINKVKEDSKNIPKELISAINSFAVQKSLSIPVTISEGGTGATTLAQAQTNLGITGGGGGSAWGGITGTLSDQTDLQAELDAKADDLGADDNYVTDAEKVVIGNTSGVNTGDQDLSTYATTANLALKAPIASPTFTGTVAGITKSMVGLANVDNTTDAGKPVSTAQQTALDLKANLASPTFTGTVTMPTPFTLGAVSVLPTGTELNFVDGVTSAIQTQLDAKAALTSPSFTTPTIGGVAIPSISSTSTITNKRNQPRIVSAASYTTDTGTSLDFATCDEFVITAQAGALLFNNPSGSPVQGEKMIVRIKDNGTARALTYGSQYRSIGATLPTTTVISKTMYIGLIYNSTDTKWDCVAVSTEA